MNQVVKPLLLDFADELQGERVTIRRWRDHDASALWEAVECSREHLKAWQPWVDEHISLDFSREYIRRMQAQWALREDLPMGIWLRANGLLLGATGLHRFDWRVPSMEIGYWLRPEMQGRGYVSEATRLVLSLAFTHLKAERVEIRCDAENVRSAAVPTRLGFAHEARLRASRRNSAGELSDSCIFAMTRADYLVACARKIVP